MNRRILWRLLIVVAAMSVIATACGDSSSGQTNEAGTTLAQVTTVAPPSTTVAVESTTTAAPAPTFEGDLVGLFSIDAPTCDGDSVSGSFFRMLQPGGTMTDGPYVPNTDSACADPSYTPLLPGTDGGLTTGAYQPAPDPAFDDSGNGLASAATAPTPFFGVAFAVSVDEGGALPSIQASGGALTGDLSAWSANYAALAFNQGSPKPDGSMPGLTSEVTGVINQDTGEYSLDWTSQIVGGSFNDFTGVWHLEGTFSN